MMFVFPEVTKTDTDDNGMTLKEAQVALRLNYLKAFFVAIGMLLNILQREREKKRRERNLETNEN